MVGSGKRSRGLGKATLGMMIPWVRHSRGVCGGFPTVSGGGWVVTIKPRLFQVEKLRWKEVS